MIRQIGSGEAGTIYFRFEAQSLKTSVNRFDEKYLPYFLFL